MDSRYRFPVLLAKIRMLPRSVDATSARDRLRGVEMMKSTSPGGLGIAAAAMVSSAVGLLVMLVAEAMVPPRTGPQQFLFTYNGELVFIDVVGGLLPLIISLEFIVMFGLIIPSTRGTAFRGSSFWFSLLGVALALTAAFSIASSIYGGFALPLSWSIALIPAGSLLGILYRSSRGRRTTLVVGFAECYVLGTLATLLSDVIRTGVGFSSLQAVAWGGGGTHDLVFWFGIYVSFSMVLFAAALSAYSKVANRRTEVTTVAASTV
jgi:hypothetical protein